MEAIPYKLRLRLSDEIPQEGQCRVMARIPAFDVPKINNSFFAPSEGGKDAAGNGAQHGAGPFPYRDGSLPPGMPSGSGYGHSLQQ